MWPMLARRSHSFACQPYTNHTCLYSPAAQHHRPLVGTHCAYPTEERPDWVDLGGWLYTEIGFRHRELNPVLVTHSSTNQARRRVTSLIETNVLPQNQTAATPLQPLTRSLNTMFQANRQKLKTELHYKLLRPSITSYNNTR